MEAADVRIEQGRYVYVVEGEPYVGTVQDVAKAFEHAHYGGVDVSATVYVFEPATGRPPAPVAKSIEITTTDYDADDYASAIIRIGDESASYRIDGRA
jgi:hypothetical protein